jgi:carbonic anhydrase/acetyltransferase-like protein (isoleucine patch superfamily)
VDIVTGPPSNLAGIDAALQALRGRFPGACFDRYLEQHPSVAAGAHVAATAAVVGDVSVGPEASIWYGCVLRGDVNRIIVGARSNIQDGTVIHVGDRDPTIVEEEVVVGHRAVLHGCVVGGGSLVGIQATLLDGVRTGRGCVIAAGALVTAGTQIPDHSLVIGVPGKVVRQLDPEEEAFNRQLALKYCRLGANYRGG